MSCVAAAAAVDASLDDAAGGTRVNSLMAPQYQRAMTVRETGMTRTS
jgi:hypothetical protein